MPGKRNCTDQQLIDAIIWAADWQIRNMKQHNAPVFCVNLCRELIRHRFGYRFSNDDSPTLYDDVVAKRPDLSPYFPNRLHRPRGTMYVKDIVKRLVRVWEN